MESSDDEGEIVAKAVTEYYFEDSSQEPVSFAKLPIHWNDGDITVEDKVQVFLRGKVDNGLHKIFEPIVAWKIDFSFSQPEILVLIPKDKNWIKLLKPRKSFEQTIRTILITVHCLHLLKNNPGASKKFLWDHLAKIFSLYENKPSVNDLVDHRDLIIEAMKMEENLKKSEVLLEILKENSRKTRIANEDTRSPPMSGFIVDDLEDDTVDEPKDASDAEEETYDSVCAFCDNGGDLLCCEGRCMRSFHATVEDGSDSNCYSLGLSQEEVEAIPNYLCKNCEYQQHQCYCCGKLGSSSRSIRAEVFKCASATCGYFYHPQCVAKWLHGEDQAAMKDLKEKILSGVTFLCPIHKCRNCNKGEVKTDTELQLAVCRRCPTAYHRKCLPRKICFEKENRPQTRAWDGLLSNRILIYCLKHEIVEGLDTPVRDHIKFPGDENKNKNQAEVHKTQSGNFRRSMPASAVPPRIPMKARKLIKPPNSALKAGEYNKKAEKISSESVLVKKRKSTSALGKSVKDNGFNVLEKGEKISHPDDNRVSLGKRLFDHMSNRQYAGDNEPEQIVSTKSALKKSERLSHVLDDESKNRINNIIDECTSSITLEEIVKRHRGPSTHVGQCKEDIDKIKQGKVEGAVEALRTALQKLDAGCSIEDAKAVCDPSVLHNVYVWKDKLKVYLAPFLHGMRYTSFGRHFTKVDKLEKIAEKLQLYVANGDTIVDFCCGANDFSCLLKTKLDSTGKKCSYRNYDILQAKNNFNFEKRDWMTVQPNELPTGSQLIMGLNPPFGYKSSLANKFIDKALKFKPKLLILIVPPQTQRLDAKEKIQGLYDLIWEDKNLLSGKSFYLPGSVDENDKQMDQWNNITPPLYLWSRSDWTARHMEIAQKHGHVPRQVGRSLVEENNFRTQNLNPPLEDDAGFGDLPMLLDDHLMQIDEPNELGRGRVAPQYSNENSSSNNRERRQDSHSRARNNSLENGQRRRGSEKSREDTGEVSVGDNQNSGRIVMNDWDLHRSSPHSVTGDIRSVQDHPPNTMPSASRFGEDQQSFRSHLPTSSLHTGTDYDGARYNYLNDIPRRHGFDNDLQYPTGIPGFSKQVYQNETLGYDEHPHRAGTPGYNEHLYHSGTAGFSGHPYPNRIPGYSEQHSHMGAASSMDTFAMQSLIHQFGREEPDPRTQRGNYFSGHEPSFGNGSPVPPPYGDHGIGMDPPYGRMNTSVMQRYAPRLDEMNPRMSPLGMQPPMGNRNGMHDYAQPPPRPGPSGFAYGPPHTFAQHGSSGGGWLNE